MQVKLQNISKTFQSHSVFKNVNLDLPVGYRGVVLGGNGSGKSTFLKILSTALVPSTGTISYLQNNVLVDETARYKHISFCAPYIDLIEDFSLIEHLEFQLKFRPFLADITPTQLVERLQLQRFKDRPLKTYSSGMRQRVRLILAIAAKTDLLLLDEPTSNLDPKGKAWYKDLLLEYAGNRSIIVGSNFLEDEFFFVKNTIELKDFQ